MKKLCFVLYSLAVMSSAVAGSLVYLNQSERIPMILVLPAAMITLVHIGIVCVYHSKYIPNEVKMLKLQADSVSVEQKNILLKQLLYSLITVLSIARNQNHNLDKSLNIFEKELGTISPTEQTQATLTLINESLQYSKDIKSLELTDSQDLIKEPA